MRVLCALLSVRKKQEENGVFCHSLSLIVRDRTFTYRRWIYIFLLENIALTIFNETLRMKSNEERCRRLDTEGSFFHVQYFDERIAEFLSLDSRLLNESFTFSSYLTFFLEQFPFSDSIAQLQTDDARMYSFVAVWYRRSHLITPR